MRPGVTGTMRRAAWPAVSDARRRCACLPPTLHSRLMADSTPKETAPQDVIPRDAARFRRTLVRVLAVQVVTLVLLWLLQTRYSA